MMVQQQAWSSEFFGCTSDYKSCCCVCWCPCLAHGQEHETVHGLGCLERSIVYCLGALCCLPACMLGPQLRADVRKQHDLDDDGCNDWATHVLCHPCAMCQELRELKLRGTSAADARAAVTTQDVTLGTVEHPTPKQMNSNTASSRDMQLPSSYEVAATVAAATAAAAAAAGMPVAAGAAACAAAQPEHGVLSQTIM